MSVPTSPTRRAHSRTLLRGILFASFGLGLWFGCAGAGFAQIPDEFENLKLLPADITKSELIGTMRGWAGDLGVRCTHCHVGPDNLQGMDFATDEKTTKQTARRMFTATRAINVELLDGLPTVTRGEGHQQIACYTCHRGNATPPRNIREEMDEKISIDGIVAAIDHYRALRDEHFAAGRYDFSARAMNAIGQRLIETERYDDAGTWYELAIEHYPKVAALPAGAALAHLRAGRLAEAKRRLEAAESIDAADGMVVFVKRTLAEQEQR